MSHTPRMTVSSGTVVKSVLKRSAGVLKMVLALSVLIYVALALTLVRVIPGVPGGAGLVVTKNDNYYGGIIPVSQASEKKEEVVIDLVNTYDDSTMFSSLVGNFKIAFFPNPNTAIVEVHAGPTGKVEWMEPNLVFVNGQQIDGYLEPIVMDEEDLLIGQEMPDRNPMIDMEFLNDAYLGVCKSGACAEGEIILFKKDQVMGVPMSILGS